MKRISPYRWWIGIPVLLLLASCDPNRNNITPAEVDGWAPVYSNDPAVVSIKSTDPRIIEKGGKIYTRGFTLYQVETGEGIHVIDISQPSSPQKQKFITVKGAQEMAIKDNYLYVNNLNDLVVVDIANLADIKEVNRVKNVFHLVDQNTPPSAGYFECIDASKGTVVGWEQKKLKHPKCRKN